MSHLNSVVLLVLFVASFGVGAKSPPPGTGKADVPANILFMVDTSGSMNSTTSTSGINYPDDVAVDSNGNRFVSNYYKHQVLKFDSTGTLLKTIGVYGSSNGQFRYPKKIAIDSSDSIYVADYYNSRIQKFDNDGKWLKNFTGLSYPYGVTVDSSGNVYAGNYSYIRKWDSDAQYVTHWSSTTAYGLSAYDGSVYAVASRSDKFYKYSLAGALESSWSTNSSSDDPYDIEVTANGIYIADYYSYVQKYNSSGTYVTRWGGYGTGDTNFRYVRGVGSDSSGNIYAADYYNHAIKSFDSDGTWISTLGGPGATRLTDAKKVIKKLVSSSDLTSGANFGLMEWDSSASIKVKVSSQGAAEIYSTVDQLSAGGSTYLATAMNLAKSYFTGVDSPIDQSANCQKSFLIVISDGEWWDDPDPIAKSLFDSLGIQTFVVGFHLDTTNTTATANYVSLAKAGETYPDSPLYSDNWQHLEATLSDYIRQAISSRLTFSAPVVMPSFSSTDHIFQSTFTYKKDHQWAGQLEKYRLNTDGSVGSLVWDAGKKLDSKAESSRKIWTIAESQGITTSLNNFTTANLTGLKRLIWENSGKSPTDTEATDLINFVRGIDVYDEDGDGSSTDERWKLADIYHSVLKIVGPPSETTNTTDPKTEAYYRDRNNYGGFIGSQRCGGSCSTRKEMIYVGANDGMLHAFNSRTGEELWAFIPPTMLPKLRDMVSAKANTSNSIFGIDGSPIVRDVFYGGTWRTLLMAGMGRGGHAYFALDVTDPDTPSFLFAFSNDSVDQTISHWDSAGTQTELGYVSGIPAEYDYSQLGEAWSTPLIMAMPYNNARKWVAVLGAGFNGGVNTDYGSAVYVIDLEDEGQVLKRIDLTNTSGTIANAVPATLTAITPDTTSIADYTGALVYFADLEAKLWKLNLSDQGTLYDITEVFDGEGTHDNDRFSYYQVSASIDQNKTLWLYYGTGDQQQLQRMNSSIQNRLFAIRDKQFPSFTTVSSSNASQLKNTTATGSVCPTVADMGWYVNLDANEKITGKIAISNESVFASRYIPNKTNICNPGDATLSEHNYTCGNGNTLKSLNLGAGVATGAVIHKGNIYIGISSPAQGTTKLPGGGTKKGNIVVTPLNASQGAGTINIESWRELW